MGVRELRRLPSGSCSLAHWSGAGDRCRWCDAPVHPSRWGAAQASPRLSGSQLAVWCGHPCEDAYNRNHSWDLARSTALARDDARCVECGCGPATVSEGKFFLRALIPMGAVDAARLWASPGWRRFTLDCQVEVHHLVPRDGAGYGSGCHHHVDGLATLCHRHHVELTVGAQRSARAAG